MYYFFEGAISSISETQNFGSAFKKREFVVTTDDKYPESIKFEFHQNDVTELDKYMLGEMVTVAFVLKGNRYNDKHFVNLKAIAIGPIENGKVKENFDKNKHKLEIKTETKPVEVLVESNQETEEDDDLPF